MITQEMERMEDCFRKLNDRVWETVRESDLDAFFENLRSLKGPTIVTGVGGSSVVSAFAAKVIAEKNGIIAENWMPRDLLYRSLKGYENALACSYSGGNIGVRATFENDLRHYLLSKSRKEGIIPLQYAVLDEERSFVSIAATFAPMALLLLYYTDNDQNLLREILEEPLLCEVNEVAGDFDILYGYENTAAATLLESTITEGGLGTAVLHEKYNYCHGRCQLQFHEPRQLIHFVGSNELDELMRREFRDYYESVIEIGEKYEDPVVNDFHQALQAMKLAREIALRKGRDISEKVVPDISEVLYVYKGKM